MKGLLVSEIKKSILNHARRRRAAKLGKLKHGNCVSRKLIILTSSIGILIGFSVTKSSF